MKKMTCLLLLVAALTACNSGNEGSDSIVVDSTRYRDSLKMEDSLNQLNAHFNIDDTTGTGTAAGDTAR